MLGGADLGSSAGLILIARRTPSGQAGRLEPQLTSSPRNAQRVMRFSTRAQIAYITTPMMAMANRPAKVVGASLRALADNIRKPMPLLPPTVSEMTEPMKAKVIATYRLAKR
jgi:hypothetical protein